MGQWEFDMIFFGKDLVGNSSSSRPICFFRINRFDKSP